MPNPNAIVSTIKGFEPSVERALVEKLRVEGGVTIQLEEGRQAHLDPDNPRSTGYLQVLEGLSKQRLPVYLELDPQTQTITQLLIPHVARVVGLKPLEGGLLGVELEFSHARHVLRQGQADYGELEKQLREAEASAKPVIVTEDDFHNIIDVRLFVPSPDGPEVPSRPFPPLAPRIKTSPLYWLKDFFYKFWYWCWWPWWWFKCRCISKKKAQQVFDAMKATSCDPLTVPAPCIPFLYPDDGCWARAHEMCRLMINMGRSPKKVWIQGSLHVNTANNPNCEVFWGWHVAPTLCVRSSFFFTKTMVIDPSLFDTPVTKAVWKSIQDDPDASLTDSAASIYYLWGSITDPSYTETNFYLNYYRLQLQNRANQYGPPPYANCL